MPGSVLRIRKSYQCFAALRTALPLFFAALLVGCNGAGTLLDSVHTLNERIARTLSTEPAQLRYEPRPDPLPSVRSLKPEGQPAGMNFLTSLRLGHCQAGQMIAQRNSSLGRLEDGLMRYRDDLRLLNALHVCVEHPYSAAIAAELRKAIEDKNQRHQYDRSLAIATDEALRHAVSIGTHALAETDDEHFTTQLNALSHLVDWLASSAAEPPRPAPSASLSEWRRQLARSDYLPRLLRTAVEMRLLLSQLQQQLPPLSEAVGCSAKGVPERANILRNVFSRFFIVETQTNLAKVTTQYQQLRPVLQQLAEQVPQPEFARYLQRISRYGEQLKQTSKDFVQPWQKMFADCGFTPGQSES